ncbi:MAG TPA: family 1 glycosylhydrolase [Armatimonadota bacterium]|nr:family 1 glycosylhydrolase [Armatimonadota bacterium]
MSEFMFATGIENSYPVITAADGSARRVDEMEKCGHYDRWKEDFALTREMGIPYLRWGPAYFRVNPAPGQYDWDFTDEALAELRRLEITPLVDLCHFGVPDWLESFQNPEFPRALGEYAAAFARRYPDVRYYTPVNEIFIAAMFSARYGWWNERLASDRSFVTAMKHLCDANLRAADAILEVRPDAMFIQSESSEYTHPANPGALKHAQFENDIRFLSMDFLFGHHVSIPMYRYLLENGMTVEEYNAFMQRPRRNCFIMGNDYYLTNEHLVYEDGTRGPAGDVLGYYVITKQYWDRYHLPVMHTETNMADEHAVPWLWKEWASLLRLREDGIPVVGFTWYSLTDQMDWDTALREDARRVNRLGLYDLDRRQRAVGRAYGKIIREWSPLLARDPGPSYANR